MILQIVAVSAFLAAGQILLKSAMPPSTKGAGVLPLLVSLFSGWRFWVACLCTGFGATLWLLTVAEEAIGVAYPVMVSLSLVFVVSAGLVVFHEPIDLRGCAGIAAVVLGIWLLCAGGK